MIIAGAVIFACSLAMLKIPSKKINKVWIYLVCVGLSSLYFAFIPDVQEDLYRHYVIWRDMETGYNAVYYLTGVYAKESPAYLVFIRLLTITGVKELLPVLTGIFCYALCIRRIQIIFSDGQYPYWQQSLCYILLFLLIRYLDISGIRNILASTIVAITSYYDLVLHKKKTAVFYLLAALIHNIAFVYIAIRLALVLYNKASGWLIKAGMLFSVLFVSVLGGSLETIFGEIPFISNILTKIFWYMETGGLGINRRYRLLYIILYLLCLFVMWYYEKYFDTQGKYKRLYEYTVIILCMTFGFIGQREMFNRTRMYIIPILIFFLAEILKEVGGKHMLSVRFAKKKTTQKTAAAGWLLLMCAVGFSVLYFFMVLQMDYVRYDDSFRFGF